MRKKSSLKEKWQVQADSNKQKAAKLPPGKERDELLRVARQLDTASHLNEWLSSPGLSPPE